MTTTSPRGPSAAPAHVKHVPVAGLRDGLERLYRETDVTMISPDPLELVLRYSDPHDREVAAFLVSAWSYGRADTIVKNASGALFAMGESPAEFAEVAAGEDMGCLCVFKGMVHRLHRGGDWAALCLFAGDLRREHGSIAGAFSHLFTRNRRDLKKSLAALHDAFCAGRYRDRIDSLGLGLTFGDTKHLLAKASRGSACKRLNLFLRWMVRKDHVDPGSWRTLGVKNITPRDLIIPLDTHVARLSRRLGLTSYSSPSWSMAADITRSLASFDSQDPVKYDFSLARLGILDICPPARQPARGCPSCPISKWCRK